VGDPHAAGSRRVTRARSGRAFVAPGPNRLWVADIIYVYIYVYIPTCAGFLHLAVILDVWSRRVVGWGPWPPLRTDWSSEPYHRQALR
jgi:transposase InsO family protein